MKSMTAKEMVLDTFGTEIENSSISMTMDAYDMAEMKRYRQRRIYLDDVIEPDSVSRIVRDIFQYNKDDEGIDPEKRPPIYIYISSVGGNVDDGLRLIDIIESSITPVYTVAVGYAYSMAFLILLAGKERYATMRSTLLMHDGDCMLGNSMGKIFDQISFQNKMNKVIKDYITSRSQLTPEEYDTKYRVEWYIFPDEAKEYGFIDKIVGVDCTLYEVM